MWRINILPLNIQDTGKRNGISIIVLPDKYTSTINDMYRLGFIILMNCPLHVIIAYYGDNP
jgi:hypothetical protein